MPTYENTGDWAKRIVDKVIEENRDTIDTILNELERKYGEYIWK